MNTRLLILPVAAATLVSAACTSAPRDGGFGDVADRVESSGGARPTWTDSAEADLEADRLVREELAQPLTVEGVVRVAVLHNRGLQAVYEELGISRGRLIQAGLPDNPVFGGDWRFFDGGFSFEGAITQNFISVFTIPMRREIRGQELEAAKRRVADAVFSVIGDARRSYVDYLTDRRMVRMEQAIVQATETSYLTAERLRQAGNIPQLPVLRERALYEESKLRLNAAVERLAGSREALNRVMSLSGGSTGWTVPEAWGPVGPPALASAGAEGIEGMNAGETPVVRPGEVDKVSMVGEMQMGGMGGGGMKPTPAPSEEDSGGMAMESEGMQTPADPAAAAATLAGPLLVGGLSSPPEQTAATPALPGAGWLGALSEPGDAALPDPLTPSAERFEGVERRVIGRSLALAAGRHRIEAQAARLKLRNTLAVFPFLNVGVTSEKDSGSGEYGLGPSLSTPIPVFDFGQGVRPEEASRVRQMLEGYLSSATELRSMARMAEVRLQTTRERAAYLRDVVLPLHAALVAESQLQYNAMAVTPFELLAAKRQQIGVGRDYLDALRAYWHAFADLQQLLDGSAPRPGGFAPMAMSMP